MNKKEKLKNVQMRWTILHTLSESFLRELKNANRYKNYPDSPQTALLEVAARKWHIARVILWLALVPGLLAKIWQGPVTNLEDLTLKVMGSALSIFVGTVTGFLIWINRPANGVGSVTKSLAKEWATILSLLQKEVRSNDGSGFRAGKPKVSFLEVIFEEINHSLPEGKTLASWDGFENELEKTSRKVLEAALQNTNSLIKLNRVKGLSTRGALRKKRHFEKIVSALNLNYDPDSGRVTSAPEAVRMQA